MGSTLKKEVATLIKMAALSQRLSAPYWDVWHQGSHRTTTFPLKALLLGDRNSDRVDAFICDVSAKESFHYYISLDMMFCFDRIVSSVVRRGGGFKCNYVIM